LSSATSFADVFDVLSLSLSSFDGVPDLADRGLTGVAGVREGGRTSPPSLDREIMTAATRGNTPWCWADGRNDRFRTSKWRRRRRRGGSQGVRSSCQSDLTESSHVRRRVKTGEEIGQEEENKLCEIPGGRIKRRDGWDPCSGAHESSSRRTRCCTSRGLLHL